MRSLASPLLRLFGPLAAAFLLIRLEPSLTALMQNRPGLLVVAMVALLGGMLVPRVRQQLIVALCFGISLLALRDTLRDAPLPPAIDYAIFEWLYPICWTLIALLAAFAGLAEALRPGSVWARRCYFGAAALYLGGRGLLGILRIPNWESLVLLVTGLVAAIGIFFAHRIVAAETEAIEAENEEMRAQAERDRRAAALAAREWIETSEEMPEAH